MKTLPALLAPQYSGAGSTLCACLKIERRDGVVFAVTSADIDVPVDSVTYQSKHGLDISSLASSAGLSVDNLELTVIPEEGDTDLALDLQTGLYDLAKFTLFECNYLDPTDGVNVLKRGTTGEVQINRGSFVIEFRGLKQALQQSVGRVVSKTCPYRLGVNNGITSLCPVVIADYTTTHTVTDVTSRQVFTASAAAEASDYYGEGELVFLDGENEGYRAKVKSFAAGVFTLALPANFTVAIGDTFSAIAGCRKRFEEDCRDKFDVAVDFGGEPHVPGVDAITKGPETSV